MSASSKDSACECVCMYVCVCVCVCVCMWGVRRGRKDMVTVRERDQKPNGNEE
jgi:hypothetical protein